MPYLISRRVRPPRAQGQVLIIAIVFMVLSLALIGATLSSSFALRQAVRRDTLDRTTRTIAQAGLEKAIFCLNEHSGTNCGGSYGNSYAGETNIPLSNGVFSSSVTTISATSKLIEVRSYFPNAVSPSSTGLLRTTATISASNVSFNYGAQMGEGGLTMQNNSSVTGTVYSNGSVSGGNGTSVSGDVWVAAGVNANTDQEDAVCEPVTPPVTCQNFDMGYQVGSEKRQDAGQKFKPTANKNLVKVALRIKKVGSPANATIRIIKDENGVPSRQGSEVIATGTLQANLITASYGWAEIALSPNPSVQDTKYYWIVFDNGPATYNAANHFMWQYDNNAGGTYAQGNGKYSTDWTQANSWNDVNANANGDFQFKTWLGSGATALTGVNVGGDAHANSINSSTIAGDAYYQTISSSTVGGVSYPGSADPPPQAMPVSDSNITEWEQAAASGGTYSGACPYQPADGSQIGPLKIPCDLNIASGTIKINGPVWVQGNITLGTNVVLVLDASFGGLGTTIVADDTANPNSKGIITVNNNVHICGSAGYNTDTNTCNPSNGSYIMLISNMNDTGSNGIVLNNNSNGAIYYTSRSKISVANNALAKQITGWGVELFQNANIQYEIGLANASFTKGPGASWTARAGDWRIIN